MINLVVNHDFAGGAWGWEASPGLDLTVDASAYGSEEHPVLVGRTSYLERLTAIGMGAREEAYAAVVPGQRLEVAAGVRALFGTSELSLIWFDGARVQLSTVNVSIASRAIGPPRAGLGPAFDYAYGRVTVPDGAAFAKIGVSGLVGVPGELVLLLRNPRLSVISPRPQ